MAHVFFISTVNGRSKKKEKKPIMSCASSGHINKLKQSIFAPLISMGVMVPLLTTVRKNKTKFYSTFTADI